MINQLLRRWVGREERRLGLPPIGRESTNPPIHFVLRVGPWMLKTDGLWRERFRTSKKGTNGKRAWQRVWPRRTNPDEPTKS